MLRSHGEQPAGLGEGQAAIVEELRRLRQR